MAKTQIQPVPDPAMKSGELDLKGLSGLLGFNIRMAQVAIYRDFTAALKALDLTQKQFAVLSLLEANPGSSQIALGTTLGTDRATMMAMVDRLQKRHLLFRARSKVDRRRQELYLTDEGLAVHAEAVRLIQAHEKQFTSRFSAPELQQLLTLLRRIHDA
jgi:DNA-binding MarR family transcriptional regulator